MLVYVSRLILNDNDPDIKFMEARVIFHDDEKDPHPMAHVDIFLGKDDKMTISQIRTLAVEKARDFLSFVANLPPSEYHQRWSDESAAEEIF